MTNKYLEKVAGIGSALKAFAGHATGKTLHGAEIKEATRKGIINSKGDTDAAIRIEGELRNAKKGTLFERTEKLAIKKNVAQTAAVVGSAAALAGAHAIGKKQGENKYLDKAAGIGSAIKAIKEFSGHYTGKTLADTRATHAIDVAKFQPKKAGESVHDLKDRQKIQANSLMKKHDSARRNVRTAGLAAGGLGAYSGLLYADAKLKKVINDSVNKTDKK